MGDENLLEYLHFELVDYCVNNKKDGNDSSSDSTKISTLEYIGFSTGYRLIERLTREMPRFKDELDTVKFLCTDFWSSIFKKQVDNLRTNHQGIYVLQDNSFRFLKQISNSSQYLELAPKYVVFSCGILRGCLANLGIQAIVTAEISTMPSCKFHIQVKGH
ncbi:CLUMA_CG001786, isoform A [Clunio marinus]|uniref:Trafficking protein particle complex subunit 6B n=1 Tax=Clunio marinus TaxID=568069 RepID=A0A1J1HIX1_9DIPT|nr:CLUMA_CG001786, isoform A [Clunio marinus]